MRSGVWDESDPWPLRQSHPLASQPGGQCTSCPFITCVLEMELLFSADDVGHTRGLPAIPFLCLLGKQPSLPGWFFSRVTISLNSITCMLSTTATASRTNVDDSMQLAPWWVRQARARWLGINKGASGSFTDQVSFPVFIQDYWSNGGAVYTEVSAWSIDSVVPSLCSENMISGFLNQM